MPLQTHEELKQRIQELEEIVKERTFELEEANARLTQEITEQKQADRELKESDQRYSALFDQSLESVFISDLEGNFLDANDVGLNLLGYKREEIPYHSFATVVSEDRLQKAMEKLSEVIETGTMTELVELELKKKDGGTVLMEIMASLIYKKDVPYAVMGIGRDISARKQAEAELKESEEQYRLLAENVNDVIWVRDQDLKMTYVSPSVERLKGFTVAEEMNRSLEESLTPESLKMAGKLFENEKEKEKTGESDPARRITIDLEAFCKDGSTKWLENNITILREEGGVATSILGVYRDVTERKKAEAELAELNKRLVEAANEAGRADIAASVLHNVGNILNSVLTSSQTIKGVLTGSRIKGFEKANALLRENIDNIEDFIVNNPKGKKLLEYYINLEEVLREENEYLSEHSDRLSEKIDLIKDVIVAQQAYASGFSQTEEMDLKKIIEDALTIQSLSILNHSIDIVKEYEEVLPVNVQKAKFIHVLVNLLKNSKAAMADNDPENKTITISLNREDKNIRLKVSDTGCGITKEELKKIFTHGFTTKKGGHGFGLHSCANYMTEMGGAMWAESDGRGKGASFVLEFPLPE